MTAQQMLEKLGITPEQAEDYKARSSEFVASLPPALSSLHQKTSVPVPADQVRQWFGPDVTQQDLADLYAAAPGLNGVVVFTNLDKP
jgi:hypothetical protein